MRRRRCRTTKPEPPKYQTFSGIDAVRALGEARLMRFLRHEEISWIGTVMKFLEEWENDKSLEVLLAPQSGYRLDVQDYSQDPNLFLIYFGDYLPGFNRGGFTFMYDVRFDQAGNIQRITSGRTLQG